MKNKFFFLCIPGLALLFSCKETVPQRPKVISTVTYQDSAITDSIKNESLKLNSETDSIKPDTIRAENTSHSLSNSN